MAFRRLRIPDSVREGTAYAAAFGIGRVTGVLLLPLLTRRLDDNELGVFGLLTSVLLVLQYGSGLGLDSAATRWFYQAEVDGLASEALRLDRRRTLSTWVWTTMLVSGVIGLAGVVCGSALANVFFDGTARQTRSVQMAALCIPGLAMINIMQHWYRIVRRPVPALVVAVLVSVAIFMLTLYLVAVQEHAAAGVFAAQALVGFVAIVIGLKQLWPFIGVPSIDTQRLREMLRYSIPLLPAVASVLLLGLLTRVLIRVFSDVGQVGEYQVVTMLATAVVLVVTAMQQTWEPLSLSIVDREGAKPMYRAVVTGYFVLAGYITLVLAAVFPVVVALLDERFRKLALPAVVISASLLINGAIPIVTTGPSIVGSGRPAFEAVTVGIVLNTVLCVLLVPRYGQIGACWASLLGSAGLVAFGWHRSERLWHVGYEWPVVLVVVGLTGLCTAGILTLAAQHWSVSLRVATITLVVAAATALTVRFVLQRIRGLQRAKVVLVGNTA